MLDVVLMWEMQTIVMWCNIHLLFQKTKIPTVENEFENYHLFTLNKKNR